MFKRNYPVEICNEWKGENGFENFYRWCMKNGYKRELVIDRKNTLLGYSPDNCRFITLSENSKNRKDGIYFEYEGAVRSLSELCGEYNISYSVVYGRLRNGWELERALSTIPKPRKKHRKGGYRDSTKTRCRSNFFGSIPYAKAMGFE